VRPVAGGPQNDLHSRRPLTDGPRERRIQHSDLGRVQHVPRHTERDWSVITVAIGRAQEIAASHQLGRQRLVKDDVAAQQTLQDEQPEVTGRACRHRWCPRADSHHHQVRDELAAREFVLIGVEVLDDLGEGISHPHAADLPVHRALRPARWCRSAA